MGSKNFVTALANLKAGLDVMGEAVYDLAAMVDGTNGAAATPARRVVRRTVKVSGRIQTASHKVQAKSLMRKLRAWRITNKLSQAQMAVKVGFTAKQATAWGHWEKSRTLPTIPHYAVIKAFAAREKVS